MRYLLAIACALVSSAASAQRVDPCRESVRPGEAVGVIRLGMTLEEVRKQGPVENPRPNAPPWYSRGKVQFKLGANGRVEMISVEGPQICLFDQTRRALDLKAHDAQRSPPFPDCVLKAAEGATAWECARHGFALYLPSPGGKGKARVFAPVDPKGASAVRAANLSAAVEEKALSYAALAEELGHGEGSRDDLCRLLDQADPLAKELGKVFEPRRDAAYDAPENESARAFSTLEEQARTLSEALPGIILANGASTFWAATDLRDLSTLSPSGPDRDVLNAAGGILGSTMSGHIEQQTDLGGCTDLDRLGDPLAQLSRTWPSASACLKHALKPKLTAALQRASRETCFCKSAADVKSAAEKFSQLTSGLDEFNGPAVGAQAVSSASAAMARYSATCGE